MELRSGRGLGAAAGEFARPLAEREPGRPLE